MMSIGWEGALGAMIEILERARTPTEQLMAWPAPQRLAFRWAKRIYSIMLERRIEIAAAFERMSVRG
jgi:hypothetical protein